MFSKIYNRLKRRIIGALCAHSNYFKSKYLFEYDRKRFLQHAGAFHQCHQEQVLASITMAYHVIEKGLTMPNLRLRFGREAVLRLISLCEKYASSYDTNHQVFQHAISVLQQYYQLHQLHNAELEQSLQKTLEQVLKLYPASSAPEDQQINISRAEFYSQLNAPFELFSKSRHTVRHFTGSVSLDSITRAVELANYAPSACNRQHTRVHCISDKDTIHQILTIQNGCRGFGESSDKLLIISTSLHDIRWSEERNDIYTNAGIFIMNLCYALHKNQIAHCILNWSVLPGTDLQLRQLVHIPDEENIVCMIACGDCPEQFSIAASPRRNVMDILTIHHTAA